MTRKRIIAYSSHCPYTEQKQTIKITYSEILLTGQSIPGHKVLSFSCPYADECPYYLQSHTGYCPVVDSFSN